MSKELGYKIRTAREDAGKTQTEVATALQLKQGAISSWEVGRTNPPPAMLKRLSQYLGLGTDYFMGESKNPFNDSYKGAPVDKVFPHGYVLSSEEEELIQAMRNAGTVTRMKAYLAAFEVLKKEGSKD